MLPESRFENRRSLNPATVAAGKRRPPEELSVLVDDRDVTILEGEWQQELATTLRRDLRLYAKTNGVLCGRLSAELIVKKSPDDGLTVIDRSVHLGNVDVSGTRKKGIGSTLLSAMERYAIEFGASRIEGIISPIDLKETPSLPEFYEHRGYTVKPFGEGYKLAKLL